MIEELKALRKRLDDLIEKGEGGDMYRHVGNLNREFGYNGFKPVPIGTPVFEFNDRYLFKMESLSGKVMSKEFRNVLGVIGLDEVQVKTIVEYLAREETTVVETKFYKDTLKPYIDFI